MTRVDPVYLAEIPGAVLVSDRASWAAAVAGRLGEPDPVMVAAFLALGYPVGAATPFRGVRALGAQQPADGHRRPASVVSRGPGRRAPRATGRTTRSRPPWSTRSGRWASGACRSSCP